MIYDMKNEEMQSEIAEHAYDTMLDLFEHPEPSQAWVDEFNKAALVMENRCDDGIDDGLPTTNHVLPWMAWLEKGKPCIASPPIVLKGASIRLTLDVLDPLRGNHINVHAIPCNENGEMLDKISNANTACLIIDSGAGPAMIFAGWDYVAREGIEAALESGAIVQSWVQVVTSKVPCLDLGTIEEQHAMKMLEVYANDNDIEHSIVEYRKVNAGKSYACNTMAVKYNKIRFHLGMDGGQGALEMEQVRRYQERLTPEQYAKWLLNGIQLTRESIEDAFFKAELEIYKGKKAMLNARKARNALLPSVVNARAPGEGIPLSLVPEEWAFSNFGKLVHDESTNRTDAIRAALVKIGRKDGFDGKRFTDIDGILCSEIVSGQTLKGSSTVAYTKYKGLLVDTKHFKSVVYEYQSCLKDNGRFSFLR